MPTLHPRRREFLKKSAIAIGSAATAPIAAPDSGTIAVGVITEPTAGHMNSYLRSLGTCGGISRIGVADATGQMFEKAKQLLGARSAALTTFTSYREMLNSQRPALILVSMEAHRAAAPAAAALEAGCHVLMEKPPCIHWDEFDNLARIASAKGRVLMLAMADRVSPVAIEARRVVREGYLGKLYGVTMNWIGDQTRLKNPAYQQSWLASRKKAGGGKLIFHGIHYLDLIQFLTGDSIQEVSAFTRNVGGQPIEVEDAAVVAMQFRSGAVGTLNTGYYLDKGYRNLILIWGSEGWLRIDLPSGRPLQWHSHRSGAPAGVQAAPLKDETDDYRSMVENAVNACRGVGDAFMTTADSARVMRIVFQAYRSAESGSTERV